VSKKFCFCGKCAKVDDDDDAVATCPVHPCLPDHGIGQEMPCNPTLTLWHKNVANSAGKKALLHVVFWAISPFCREEEPKFCTFFYADIGIIIDTIHG
jgi:hypothetical protein